MVTGVLNDGSAGTMNKSVWILTVFCIFEHAKE